MRRYARAIKRRVVRLSQWTSKRVHDRIWPKPWTDGRLGYYGVWSLDPPIFVVGHVYGPEGTHRMMAPLYEHLHDRPAWFLFRYSWRMEDVHRIALERQMQDAHIRQYPKHRFLHLCNTRRQLELFDEARLPAIFFSSNALVDERIFRPMPEVEKRFDAVYDARINRFKRHELALDVPSLALMYTRIRHNTDLWHRFQMRRRLRHAHHFNRDEDGGYRTLTDEQVAHCYNRCRVGLCLSAIEGANYASIQHLLCGLPIVSTRSEGGRDVFFDEQIALIVDDDPSAVQQGVERMIAPRS